MGKLFPSTKTHEAMIMMLNIILPVYGLFLGFFNQLLLMVYVFNSKAFDANFNITQLYM